MTDEFKKLFGAQAANYTKYREPYPQELFDVLVKLIPKGATDILDVACGTGKSAEPLLSLGIKVTGVDHDPLMVEEAKKQAQLKRLDISYVVSDVEHLPFPDGHFDAITVGTALHFFVNEGAMSEMKRALKPGGLLFVYWTLTTKDMLEEDEIPGSIYRKYNWLKVPSELRDLANISDFFGKSSLIGVSMQRIPVTSKATVEERVGLQTTSGTYELLSPEDKIRFLDEVRGDLTRKLGTRKYFTLEEEIQVCYGFKA